MRVKIETNIGQTLQAAVDEQAQTRLRSAPRARGLRSRSEKSRATGSSSSNCDLQLGEVPKA